ncbi:beta-ketoacyl synthase N-terminal-like domain-containing protein [Actinophytocola xinjiangensis]|uniref:beta-ketoacyl synthase N-terminal-like domain-containing protein n=1 Tax=Actinophytocola xinjiangensis TaxID=485602 RepID=UPI003CCC0AA4
MTADLHQTRQRLAQAENVRHEPVAIIGMACRFPGDVRSPADLWGLLTRGEHGIGPLPADRGWDPTLDARGGFIADAASFDAEFFDVAPGEALSMDPQQRQLLEVSWEAVERAGIDPESLRGSGTGVFVGTNGQDYRHVLLAARQSGTEELAEDDGSGVAASVISGRLSYTFGLEGPSVTVDTACSSSLVTLHLAAKALRDGECALALAGGATVLTTSTSFVHSGVPADGQCKAFAEEADGIGWSEGVGMLVLERLSDARRNGHPVLAVVRGSSVNSDGASNGLTAPNGPSQQRLIRQALASAGLSTADVDVVDAHGTGTQLGDPIEAQALLATYGQNRATPLLVGSVKSNLGHTQAAAGVAGIIKMVLALRHGVVPATLHVANPSSLVDWTGGIALAASRRPWPGLDRPRRAAVSAFGIGGTNAHVILEQAPSPDDIDTDTDTEPVRAEVLPFVVSGATAEALTEQIARLRGADRGPASARDVAHTLAHRTALAHRVVFDGDTVLARGTATHRELGVLLPGAGTQRPGMGRELYARFPAFASVFDEVSAELDPLLSTGLREAMWGTDPAPLETETVARPAVFAVEVALFRLAESVGLRPEYVAGHSVAAAHVAGALSLREAAMLVVAQGRLVDLHLTDAADPLLAGFRSLLDKLTFSTPRVPLGITEGDLVSAEYWLTWRPVTEVPGATAVLTLGPQGPDGEERAFVAALAGLHVLGSTVDWTAVLAGIGGRHTDLPTYAFQSRRWWPAFGAPDGRALLDATFVLASTDVTVLSGTLSLATHPWIADHRVGGQVLLPGSALLEMAGRAAAEVGLATVEDLVLQVPVALAEGVEYGVQVIVSPPDPDGRRAVDIHARAGHDGWVHHATGVLAPAPVAPPALSVAQWPPPGATPVDVSEFYHSVGEIEAGINYGPAFRGLRAAWVLDGAVYVDVELPEAAGATEMFGVHPALLDAVLHADVFVAELGEAHLPFEWRGVTVHAPGARALRARLAPLGQNSFEVAAVAHDGEPVLTVSSLALRARTLSAPLPRTAADDLYRVDWLPAEVAPAQAGWAVVGTDVPDFATLAAGPVPELVAYTLDGGADLDAIARVTERAAGLVGTWLGDPRFASSCLVVRTEGAVDPVTDPAAAAAWGVVRAAQRDHPGRFLLLDGVLDETAMATVPALLAAGETEVAVRDGVATLARLAPVTTLATPAVGPWRLDTRQRGSLDDLALVPHPEADAPLAPHQVRVAVRAAGMNFRDVLNALGRYPGEAGPLGSEAAGVVIETGRDVTDLAVGDRVMGMLPGGFGPVGVTDARLLTRTPADWDDRTAASVPLVFLTAHHALGDLARLQPGERVLVHAGAGGVGMAAIQLARHAGAEVFATASESKWETLRELGLSDDHIASSRDLGFSAKFGQVDVVLNSLTGSFIDSSLDLLDRGGRFLEMGKTDLRDPASLPDISYQAFDLGQVDPARIRQMLEELVALFASGAIATLPVRAWDVRAARDAFRHMSNAKHVGKLVLTVPRPAHGAVLVTGDPHGRLTGHLDDRAVRTDATSRDELATLIDEVAPDAIVHAGPSTTVAWHLHELTTGRDLSAFVLLSPDPGVFGSADGAVLDAIAGLRRAAGLAATVLAGPSDPARLDVALGSVEPVLVPRPGEHADLPVLRDLAADVGGSAEELAERFLALDDAGRGKLVSEVVRGAAAAVLGRGGPRSIDPRREFRMLGFDSLTSGELRNRLTAATGLPLPATLVFDYPTPAVLTEYVTAELLAAIGEAGQAAPDAGGVVLGDLARVESVLAAGELDEVTKAGVSGRLRALLALVSDSGDQTGDADMAEKLNTASASDLLAFIDNELGRRPGQ